MNKEELGKFFILGFPRGIRNEHLSLIRKIKPSGIILYPQNMKNLSDLQISIEMLYEIIDEGIKLFISSDHEGGQLETIPSILPSPGNKALGSTGLSNYSFLYGDYLGKELKKIGFNMLFAPVLDIISENSSPVVGLRSFSKSQNIVSEYGNQFIKGLARNKIIPTAKHFPGHGKATQDSHYEIPIISNLTDKDIFPFKSAIEFGVKSIMTAHVLYPHLDKDNIATLSQPILKNLLRERLGYDGIIISDAIEMKAIHDNYSPKEIVEKFFSATGDLLLVGDADENFKPLYNEIQDFYSSGESKKKILEESYKRIISLQEEYIENTYETRFLTKVAKQAIKTNFNEKFSSSNVTFVIPRGDPLSPADTSNNDYLVYEDLIKNMFKNPHIVTYNVEKGPEDFSIENNDLTISFVVDSFNFEEQLKMHKKLQSYSKEVIYLILRDERDVENYRNNKYVQTNSTKPISVYYALKSFFNL